MQDLEVTPERARELADEGAELVDVREPYEHEAGHIAGDRHIEMMQLTGAAESLPRDRPVVFYCRVGSRSMMAAQAFRRAGYDAYSMGGGLDAWHKQGLPIEPEDGHVAPH